MPVLICVSKKVKKSGKKEPFYYIVENKSVVENNMRKRKRVYLKSLGRITKTQAHIELDRFISEQKKINEKSNSISFSDAVAKAKVELKKEVGVNITDATFQDFRNRISKCIKFFDAFEIHKISYKQIESFKQELINHGLANRSINLVLIQLKKVFKWALRNEYIKYMPLIEFLSQKKANIIDRLNSEQIKIILDSTKNEKIKFYIRFMLLTGMRPNEFQKLKWKNISLEEGYIHVISDNKNKKGRKIPVLPELRKLIHSWRDENYILNENVSPYVNYDSVIKFLARIGGECGIKLTSYKLRKTFASIMAESGVDRGKLAEIMGNSIATGEKYYIDVQHQHLREEMAVMDNTMSSLGGLDD